VFGFGRAPGPPPRIVEVREPGRICTRHKCRAKNPPQAQFCRRCGQSLPAAQRVNVRRHRAAVW
jgi:ribosomal protein L40E